MSPRAEPPGYRLACQDLEAGSIGGDGERENAFWVAAAGEGRGQGYVAFVAVGRRGRQLLAAGDDDAVPGLFDDMQRNFLVLLHGRLLVLRLSTAVNLRVAESMGEEEVVAHAVPIVIFQVFAEVAFRVPDRTKLVFEVKRGNDVGREDVGAAAELAPGELVPQLAVPPLASEILCAPRQQPAHADAPTGRRVDAGHLVAVRRAAPQIVDARQLGDHVLERQVRGDILDALAIDPNLAAVSQAFDVASAP